jgi:hypothetical protein
MIPLTPSLLVAAATAFVGLGEDGDDNRGQMVELFLREVRQPPGQPWCAAFVHHVGYWSHYDHTALRSTWPLPATASCFELGEFARERGWLLEQPALGDVFLLRSKELKRFAHTGVVVELVQSYGSVAEASYVCTTVAEASYVCTTIEGNTNADGSRNGNTTLRKTRRFSIANGDRFIRWVGADSRDKAA